jgi:hypothetical protein
VTQALLNHKLAHSPGCMAFYWLDFRLTQYWYMFPNEEVVMDQATIAYWLSWVGIGAWVVCFWWMHRISARQDALLTELRELAQTQHDILREIHPDVGEMKEQVVPEQGAKSRRPPGRSRRSPIGSPPRRPSAQRRTRLPRLRGNDSRAGLMSPLPPPPGRRPMTSTSTAVVRILVGQPRRARRTCAPALLLKAEAERRRDRAA